MREQLSQLLPSYEAVEIKTQDGAQAEAVDAE